MTIDDNKEDLRQKSSHLPQIDLKKEQYQSTEDLQKGHDNQVIERTLCPRGGSSTSAFS